MAAVLKSQTLLVDDHPTFRAGLALTVAREPDIQVVGEATTANEALDVARSTAVDIAVIDVLMPHTSGVSLVAELHDIRPGCVILALSVLDDPTIIAMMLRAGAAGYAIKTQDAKEIADAMRTVLGGVRYLPPGIASPSLESLLHGDAEQPLQRLTRREREVFDLLLRGSSNQDISSALYISHRTVETHRQRIMKKLGVHSLLDMIRLAARHGMLPA